MTDPAGDEIGAVDLDHMAAGQELAIEEDATERAGDFGLARAGASREHEMMAGGRGGEASLDAASLELCRGSDGLQLSFKL